MFFAGHGRWNTGNGGSFGGISYATSTDLLTWTIIGTDNYHIYQGLNGYNGSDEFYQIAQEGTPVWDGEKMAVYFWNYVSDNIGKIELDAGTFENVFRGFIETDNFTDNIIDKGKWIIDNSGAGITASETGGKLQVFCDGLSNSSNTFVVESKRFMNNDDGMMVCCFDFDRSIPTTGDFWLVEISNADRSEAIKIQRSTTANKMFIRYATGGVSDTNLLEVDFDGTDIFKIVLYARNKAEVWKGNGLYFELLDVYDMTDAANDDFTFKILAGNSIGGGQTITLDNFAFGEFDSGKVSTFKT